ncbi:hypothetical protein [Herbiconiux sp. L3-i23]|uniref:hypothetical protein n=1 Tax=Herbiconiux sp. L3-i23 TaxID=2905871 RepID=UPI00204F62EA|nr:hypothetical protein [Herbiconiux sp. L3-i23]BDI23416.1 hypothetical protein L3i23_21920 [Herbiconiux sp. L3-i23]
MDRNIFDFAVKTPAPAIPAARTSAPTLLARLGGVALIAAPLLLMGGALTSPPQTAPGQAGYIESLAADPAVSLLSANLFHYGWVAFALGALATIALVTGRRGRVWVRIAAVVLAFGAIQMSGLLLSDWFLIGAGNALPIDQAVAVDTAAKESSALVWLITAQVGTLLAVPALTLGLARARVLSWWIAPLAALPFVVLALNLGPFGAVLGTLLYAPVFIAGAKLVAGRPVD